MKIIHCVYRSLFTLLVVAAVATAQVGDVVEVLMPINPVPVPAEGHIHLAYELHLTNLQSENPALLTGVQAIATGDGRTLARLEGEELARAIRIIGTRDVSVKNGGVELKAGSRAVLFMWLSLEPGSEPDSITHRIQLLLMTTRNDTEYHEFDTEPLGLGPTPALIAPPLRGDWWVVDGGGRRQNNTGHRHGVQISVRGRAPIAQRFARDFGGMVEGHSLIEGREGNASFYAWGKEVLAVADGIVVDILDGIPENQFGGAPGLPRYDVKTLLGNHVVLDIGGGRFATYGHMQPGKMRVKVGDQVHPGDVLGLVGNSGASGGPHLHFQITDDPSPLAGEGLPYMIDSFEVVGKKMGFDRDSETWDPQPREKEMPMENFILRFQER